MSQHDDIDDVPRPSRPLPAALAARIAAGGGEQEEGVGSADTDRGRLTWAPGRIVHAPRASTEAEHFEPVTLGDGEEGTALQTIELARGTRDVSRGWLPDLLGVEPRRIPCLIAVMRTAGGDTLELCAPIDMALLEGLPSREVAGAAQLEHGSALLELLACASEMSAAPPEPLAAAADAEAAIDLAALDPHSVAAAKPPAWPERPAELVTRGLALKWADYLVFQVERVVVVYMLAMMSVAMFLDMFYLSLVRTNESNLARFLMGWYGRISGGELDAAAAANFTATVIFLELIAFGGLCYLAASTRLKNAPVLTRITAAVWVCVACVGFADLVRNNPARVAYLVLLGAAVAGSGLLWFFTPRGTAEERALRTSRLWVFAALLLASPLLAWFFSDFPDNFSFAQRQSLFWLLWVGFIGASMATYQRAHLGIDFVRKLVRGERAKRLYNVASLLVTLAFTACFLYVAWDYIFHPQSGAYYKDTPAGEIADWHKVGIIPLSLAIMCARYAIQAGEDLVAGLRPPRPRAAEPTTTAAPTASTQEA